MAMRIRWYCAEHIAQYGRSRATLDATGCRQWAIICPVLPQSLVVLFLHSKPGKMEFSFPPERT